MCVHESDFQIDNWSLSLTRPVPNGLTGLIGWVFTALFPLRSTKVNYLYWQLKWLWPGKRGWGGREEKKIGGIILLPCDFHLPLRFWKWQDAECFCLLINISEHYTGNAPVTLNIGPVRTPRLFLSDMSSSNARWKLKKKKKKEKKLYIKVSRSSSFPREICGRMAGRYGSRSELK